MAPTVALARACRGLRSRRFRGFDAGGTEGLGIRVSKTEQTLDIEGRMPHVTRYAQHPSWLRYRELLAERLGCPMDATPEERRWPWNGHDVHLDVWPAESARGVVILVHGGGGHGRLLAPLGAALSARGYRCLAPDLPGFGLTRVRPGWRGDYGEWPRLVAELARAEEPPVALMGLSMGGMTAVYASQRASVAAVVATTLLDASDPAAFRRAARHPGLGALSQLAFGALGSTLDGLALPLGLVAPLRALTADPVLADYFATDPLLGRRRVPLGFWRTASTFGAPLTCRAPLALLHPGADAWTPTALSEATLARLDAPEKHFRELTGGAHAPFEAPALAELVEATDTFLRRAFDRGAALGRAQGPVR
jgi:alpha-beta hydrolase superfamily lysophospholipase